MSGFKRFDVDTELQNLRGTPAKPAKAANQSSDFSDFSDFSRGEPAKLKNSETAFPAPSPLRDRYHQTVEAVLDDCFALDPLWLAEAYPDLWHRMTFLDLQLNMMERRNAPVEEYEATLEKLVATVKQARILYEAERRQQEAVQQ